MGHCTDGAENGRILNMFSSKFRICDVFGIPVYLDMSLVVLLVLFVLDFGSFSFGLACALALAVSITLH